MCNDVKAAATYKQCDFSSLLIEAAAQPRAKIEQRHSDDDEAKAKSRATGATLLLVLFFSWMTLLIDDAQASEEKNTTVPLTTTNLTACKQKQTSQKYLHLKRQQEKNKPDGAAVCVSCDDYNYNFLCTKPAPTFCDTVMCCDVLCVCSKETTNKEQNRG